MSKRNWPDHIAVGRTIDLRENGGRHEVRIVDVKAGPMLGTIDFKATEIPLTGTLQVKVKPVDGGPERWLPPTEGAPFVKWCEQQDAKATGSQP